MPPEPPPPVGPLAIVEVLDASAGQCTVVVNAVAADPLDDPAGSGTATKWTMRFGSTLYQGSAIINAGVDRFIVQYTVMGVQLGSNVISYANAPSDIRTVSGRALPMVSGQAF